MRLFAWLLVGGSALAGVTLLGCPPGEPDICEGAACVGADGGSDGSQTDGSTCDPSKDPSCVSDASGIFVNGSSGADSNAGTKESPVKTIGAALTKATGAKNSVYICAGTYAEHLKVSTAVNLYGGFACADWSYAATNRPKIAPSDAGYALDIESISSAISIQDLEFDAKDGVKTGDSSIAVFVNSSDVTFTRAFLVAGTGIAGANGTLTTLTFPDQTALNGNNADGGAPGIARSVDCPGDAGTTVGGAGGASGVNGDPGEPALDGGAGGTVVECTGSTGGHTGANAAAVADGIGASASGLISSTGWLPASGTPGSTGGPGQGGGGGAGLGTFGGGGGGAGACGGGGGGGGAGGGASIALLANASTITLSASTLSAGNAGAGGAGVGGQPGQSPAGFHGNSAGTACVGGAGGNGGNGGAGGGGAGGVSVGVLYKGTAPTIDQPTQNAISTAPGGGAKGTGGISGTNDGIAGVAQATLEIK